MTRLNEEVKITMSSNCSKEIKFYRSEEVVQIMNDKPSTTTMIDTIFIPSKRIPKELLKRVSSKEESLEQILSATKPIIVNSINQPYWKKGKDKRIFDSIDLEVYSAVCLAEDRHLLEAICSIGGLYPDLSGLTLRQAISAAKKSAINIETSFLPARFIKKLDNKIFSGFFEYFLIDFNALFKFLDMRNTKSAKAKVLERLRRLSQMLLLIRYYREGKELTNLCDQMKLVDSNVIPLLVMDKIKCKKSAKEDTITHLIVGVDRTFTASLTKEGSITRERLLSVYPFLNGPGNLIDFCKFLDQHKREYVHGKQLSEVVKMYYQRKAYLPKSNTNVWDTIQAIINKKDIIYDKFSLLFKELERDASKKDYMVIYADNTK